MQSVREYGPDLRRKVRAFADGRAAGAGAHQRHNRDELPAERHDRQYVRCGRAAVAAPKVGLLLRGCASGAVCGGAERLRHDAAGGQHGEPAGGEPEPLRADRQQSVVQGGLVCAVPEQAGSLSGQDHVHEAPHAVLLSRLPGPRPQHRRGGPVHSKQVPDAELQRPEGDLSPLYNGHRYRQRTNGLPGGHGHRD